MRWRGFGMQGLVLSQVPSTVYSATLPHLRQVPSILKLKPTRTAAHEKMGQTFMGLPASSLCRGAVLDNSPSCLRRHGDAGHALFGC